MPLVEIDRNGIVVNGVLFNTSGESYLVGNDIDLSTLDDKEIVSKSNNKYNIDVSLGGCNFYLPENALDGNKVHICDNAFSYDDVGFDTNNVTVSTTDGSKINKSNSSVILNLSQTTYEFTYDSSIDSWGMNILSTRDISKMLGTYSCELPLISKINISEVFERSFIEVSIDNYNESYTYGIDDKSNIVFDIKHKSGNVFFVYFGGVEEDTEVEFSINSYRDGLVTSPNSEKIKILVKAVAEIQDDSILNDLMSDNVDISADCDVSNDIVTFTDDGGEYKEVVTIQGDEETEWSGYQTTVCKSLEALKIFDDSSADTLVVNDILIDAGSKIIVVNDENLDGVDAAVDNINIVNGTTDITDIFEDGSCISLFNFENTPDDKDRNVVGTVVGNEEYSTDGVFGSCYKFDGESCINTKGAFTDYASKYSLSFFAKVNETEDDDSNQYIISFGEEDGKDVMVFGTLKVGRYMDDTKNYRDTHPLGEFEHYAMTFDAGEIEVFINGESMLKDTFDLDGNDRLLIGSDMDDSDNVISGLVGSVDHFRFFADKILTSDEIISLRDEKETTNSLDISSSEFLSTPTNAYKNDEYIEVQTAISTSDIADEDFKKENELSFKVDIENSKKVILFEKVSDYVGVNFQRKVIGDNGSNFTSLSTEMWKEEDSE